MSIARCGIAAETKPIFAPYLWMLGSCFALAWMGQFAHLLKDACDWRIVALARAGLAFVLATGLARLAGAPLVFRGTIPLWVRGFASSVSLVCTFFALAQLRSSEVLTLTNTFPIWIAFLSWPLLRTAPSLSVWLAAGFGVVGVVLIKSPEFDANATLAVVLSLIAALSSAIAMLGLHRVKGIHPWAIVVHYQGVATVAVVLLFAGSYFWDGIPDLTRALKPSTLFLLLGVGVTATLGQMCVTRAFTDGPPTRIAVVGLMQIVFALGLDMMIEGPTIHVKTLIGIAFVLAPTAWMMGGGNRK